MLAVVGQEGNGIKAAVTVTSSNTCPTPERKAPQALGGRGPQEGPFPPRGHPGGQLGRVFKSHVRSPVSQGPCFSVSPWTRKRAHSPKQRHSRPPGPETAPVSPERERPREHAWAAARWEDAGVGRAPRRVVPRHGVLGGAELWSRGRRRLVG